MPRASRLCQEWAVLSSTQASQRAASCDFLLCKLFLLCPKSPAPNLWLRLMGNPPFLSLSSSNQGQLHFSVSR